MQESNISLSQHQKVKHNLYSYFFNTSKIYIIYIIIYTQSTTKIWNGFQQKTNWTHKHKHDCTVQNVLEMTQLYNCNLKICGKNNTLVSTSLLSIQQTIKIRDKYLWVGIHKTRFY